MTAPDLDNCLIAAINTFAFQLFGQVSRRIGDHNIFISPLSITYALVLLHLGSDGTTRQELAQVLGIQNIELNEANFAYAQLQHQLTQYSEQEVLTLANSLWVKQEEQLKPEFIQSSKDLFVTEVFDINFANSNAANIINEWVNQKTNQKISKIIDQEDLNFDTTLILLNAIYFKGSWKNSFSKAATKKTDFALANSQLKLVEMMNQSGEYEYFQDENYQAITIPYQDENVSIVIFLPSEQSSLDNFQQQLDNHSWQQWQNQFSRQRVYLSLPRFKIEYEDSLMEDLHELGLDIALGCDADYQNICNKQIAISDIKHKTFMEVNEEGTEAAATTSILMQRIVGGTFSMVIDRPFFCVIKHNQTGAILFMGAIWEPN
jgi:serine protease inhibitor